MEIALAISVNPVRMRSRRFATPNLDASRERDPALIRHCVFLSYRDDIAVAERQSIYRDLQTLCDDLPGALAVSSGTNVSPETGMDKGYSEGFVIDFADAATRDNYLVHPQHQLIAGRIVAAAQDGVEGVLVFDLEV